MSSVKKSEQRAYTFSFFGAFFMAVLGFLFAFATDSEAILLDGVFSSINMAMIALTLYVCIKVLPLVNNRFQFGLSQMEPIVNIAKACLFAAAIIFAIYSAVVVILHGGRRINFDLGIIYALAATLGCLLMTRLLSVMNKINPTPLLAVEVKGWLVDAALSSAILFVFLISRLIQNTTWAVYLPYVDPSVLLIISVVIIPIPLTIFKDNFLELLTSAPSIEKQAKIEKILTKILAQHGINEFSIRTGKTGRQLDIWVMCLRQEKQENSIDNIDSIRRELYKKFEVPGSHICLYIEATADETIYERETAYS